MAFNIYFRGMPYVMTIDDNVPFTYNNGALSLTFANIGLGGGSEGPLLEKLWAKMNNNYELTSSGWEHEALRVLVGAPAYDYLCSSYQAP
jgi:hypothetical protein